MHRRDWDRMRKIIMHRFTVFIKLYFIQSGSTDHDRTPCSTQRLSYRSRPGPPSPTTTPSCPNINTVASVSLYSQLTVQLLSDYAESFSANYASTALKNQATLTWSGYSCESSSSLNLFTNPTGFTVTLHFSNYNSYNKNYWQWQF